MPVRRNGKGSVAAAARVLTVTAAVLAASAPYAAPTAAGATDVYADPAGLCAGLVPCYTTAQSAVDHAAPAPATVGLFPATYAENVDLDAMGSAAGGGPGDVTLQALDAAGMPATTGVKIIPAAGIALTAGQVVPFAGGIALRGLTVTSPDAVGFGFIATGDVELTDVVVEHCGDNGGFVLVQGAGAFTAARVVAQLNHGSGLIAGAATATIEDAIGLRNDVGGIAVGAAGPVVARRVQALSNGDAGFGAVSCTSVDIEDVTADTNDGDGALVEVHLAGCPLAAGAGGSFAAAPWRSPARLGFHAPSARSGPVPAVVTVDRLAVHDNGGLGAGVAGESNGTFAGGIVLADVAASGNEGFGLFAAGDHVQLTGGTLTDNLSGGVLVAGTAAVSATTASDNAPAVFTPPREGAGLYLAAQGLGELTDLDAGHNAFAGAVLDSSASTAVSGPYLVVGGHFAGNGAGIAATGDGVVDVEVAGAEATGNSIAGLTLPNLRRGSIRGTTASGNLAGVVANVSDLLDVRESEVAANQEGLVLVVQSGATARVHCTNVRGNTPLAGLELLSGDAVDARAVFWGDPTGPTHPGNPGGLGDLVEDGANGGAGVVDYSGYLAAEATADDCLAPPVVEVPTAGGFGLALLALLLAAAGTAALGVRRPSA